MLYFTVSNDNSLRRMVMNDDCIFNVKDSEYLNNWVSFKNFFASDSSVKEIKGDDRLIVGQTSLLFLKECKLYVLN